MGNRLDGPVDVGQSVECRAGLGVVNAVRLAGLRASEARAFDKSNCIHCVWA